MTNIFKGIIHARLAKKNQEITSLTEVADVKGLLEKLYPLQYEKGLVRIGPNGDGGYLVPDDLDDIQACFSPGVDKISEFELWCHKNGMEIYLADKSVEEVNLDIPKDQYGFIKKFVGCTNNEDYITLDEWVNANISNKTSDLLLQMDIEGGEYDTFINVSDTLMQRFRIMVVEFHNMHKLWNPEFFRIAEIVFNKILQTHKCVHIHPNNCWGIFTTNGVQTPPFLEFTFIRKDRITSTDYARSFPHPLDYDCSSDPHMVLPEDWYKSEKMEN